MPKALKIELPSPYGTDMYLARDAKEFVHYFHRRYGLTKAEYKAMEKTWTMLLGHNITTVEWPLADDNQP